MKDTREQSREEADEAVRRARQELQQEVDGVERLTGQVGIVPRGPWTGLVAAAGVGLGAGFALRRFLSERRR